MKKIIEKIIEHRKKEGWDIFKKMKSEILQFDSKYFLINCFNHEKMNNTYMSAMLLIIPELWKNFNLEDWLNIMRAIERPKKYRLYMDDSAHFEDIKFLYNWIEIDSIKLFKEDLIISNENKRVLNKIFPGYLRDLIKSNPDYMEDFNDKTFGEYKHLEAMRERLISQGAKPLKN